MTAADGIESGFFENLYLAFFSPVDCRRALWAIVMVEASSLELDCLAIETESGFCIKYQVSDPKSCINLISFFPFDKHCHACLVEVWILNRP